MNVKYALFAYEFNRTLWAAHIAQAIAELGARDFAALIGVDAATVNNWANMTRREGYRWPSMQSFMAVVNALDLHPSDFFVIEEK